MRQRLIEAIAVSTAAVAIVLYGWAYLLFSQPLISSPVPQVFATAPKDRPVLETPQQVYEARVSGVAVFRFDGKLHVVRGLPKEYIDYSSRYVRMP